MSSGDRRVQKKVIGACLITSCLVVASVSGCASSRLTDRAEVLESRLRAQETEIESLEERLRTAQWSLTALRQENESLRESGVRTVSSGLPEQADQSFRVSRIEINSLLSGGLDRDSVPGDEYFTVLITPKDPSGNTLRVAGELHIQVYDFRRADGDQEIGNWRLSRSETSEIWHQGIVGNGYQFTSSWQKNPTQHELVVHVRLLTIDGRQFDVSGPIKVYAGSGAAITDKNSVKDSSTLLPPVEVGSVQGDEYQDRTVSKWTKTSL